MGLPDVRRIIRYTVPLEHGLFPSGESGRQRRHSFGGIDLIERRYGARALAGTVTGRALLALDPVLRFWPVTRTRKRLYLASTVLGCA